MSEIKITITEQFQQLQMLMHRTSLYNFKGAGKVHNPHRGQGRVLAILKMKPEISQKELTYLLNMSKQSLAELLAKLEKSGYITREPSEEDKRVMKIKLTESGTKATDDVDDETLEASKILDCLNDEELSLFSEYLGRIIKRYEEQFPNEDFEQRRKSMEEFMLQHGHGHGFGGFGGHSVHGGPHGNHDDDFCAGHRHHNNWRRR
ncbi:transcriptional regulator SlyA [Oxobacter pfennigii]|uniref:Transcriptional regulator SlyA n=1 Tax=Oxobacter pfennigii TaxID=36849 RepID=A0A0P8WDM1_9CLOT|nr:MarR family transcriptional regulator [Oxobacter pfennigii]KPU45851.1 transcriptional regulator SlyA [Oxobacter pfennigii]